MFSFLRQAFFLSNLIVGILIVPCMILLGGCPSSESEFVPAPKLRSGWPFQSKCRVQVNTTVSAVKSSLTVKYSEPTTRGNGKSLTNLSHTTIYVGTGSKLTKMKEVPASSPTGGGRISEVLRFPISGAQEIKVNICVTATDSDGHES